MQRKVTETEDEKKLAFFHHHAEALKEAQLYWFHDMHFYLEMLEEQFEEDFFEEQLEELREILRHIKHLLEKTNEAMLERQEHLHHDSLHPHPFPTHHDEEDDY